MKGPFLLQSPGIPAESDRRIPRASTVSWPPPCYLLRQGHGHCLAQLVQTAINPVPPPLFYHFVGNGGSLRTDLYV